MTINRVARLKSANPRARAHVAHVLSRRLARTAGLVAIEELRIRSMTAFAAGTAEAPGRNVRQKSGLNRSILNVGWHMFERVLSYKMEEYGGVLVKVKPHHMSQECAKCHHVDANSRESQAVFVCVACGETANADVNAACVIEARALALDEYRRWNTPLLDVEGKATAPDEASTDPFPLPRWQQEGAGNPGPSGPGRC